MTKRRDYPRMIFTSSTHLLDQGVPLWGEEIAPRHDKRELIAAAMDGLPEKHYAAVTMRLSGWTFQHIADLMEWPSRGYAYMYWQRGLQKLKVELEAVMPEMREA